MKGAWEAQSGKRPTLDLRVVSSSSALGSTLGVEPNTKQNRTQHNTTVCEKAVLLLSVMFGSRMCSISFLARGLNVLGGNK